MSSFLFQNKPNQPTSTQQNLFGQPMSFDKQQSGMTSQLFPSQASTQTTTGLFGNKNQSSTFTQIQNNQQQPQTQGLGIGQTGQLGQIGQLGQLGQSLIPSYDDKKLFDIFSNYKDPNQSNEQFRMYFKKEIENIINNFILSIETRSPYNLFKNIFYNRIPFNKDNQNNIDYIYQFQVYNQIIKGEDGNETYFNKQLHSKGLEKNPNNKKYYAIPICSPNQLSLRNKTNLVIQLSTIKNIYDLKSQYNKLSDRYNKEIEGEVSSLYIKKNKIKEKLIRILAKSEKVALLLKRAEVNSYKEYKIKESLMNINSVLMKENIMDRIQVLKRNFENNIYLRSNQVIADSSSKLLSGYSDESLNKKFDYYSKCLSSLKKMSVDIQKNLIDNQSEIIFMSKELDLIQKYDKNRIYK